VRLALGAAAASVFALVFMIMAMAAAVGQGQPTMPGAPTAVDGIPPAYLALYVQAAQENGIDWAILAAIGSIESDHGRLQGGRCAVSSAGARGPMQFLPSTWVLYGKGGDICDPVDAIPGAARYLVASGAPKDYHRAILAYNHAEWYYRDVMKRTEEYRAAADVLPTDSGSQSGPLSGTWLVPVPGTDVQCDARIVPNVLMIINQFHAHVGACYSATGHEPSGEHSLGLAVDLTPAPPASWQQMAALARYAGWRPSCASSGCASQTHTAFRFVGWNGYAGHGDPVHAGSNAHLHLSWNHGPGRPAEWVSLVGG
jgi:hypothetical protein